MITPVDEARPSAAVDDTAPATKSAMDTGLLRNADGLSALGMSAGSHDERSAYGTPTALGSAANA